MSHSILSPSSAKQWTECTASIRFIKENAKRIPPDRGSVYAQIGTQAHDYAEKILTGKMKAKSLPAEFAQVLDYTSRCEALRNRWGGTVLIEERVPLFYLPRETGTVDFALLCDHGLFIRDLKWGEGVAVAADGNKQLAIYAHSLVIELAMLYTMRDDLPVEIGIISPRYVGEEIEKVWITTVKELREFVETHIAPAAELILEDLELGTAGTEFKPSLEACRWCKAKDICKVRYREALQPIGFDEFSCEPEEQPIVIPDPATMTDAQLLKIFANSDVITNVMNTVGKLVLTRALSGDPIPGTKLVAGREGNTEWQLGAEPWLEKWIPDENQRFTRKLISPTQAFKLMKSSYPKEVLETYKRDYTRRSPGKPSVALESDHRPAIKASLDEFTTLEEDENE